MFQIKFGAETLEGLTDWAEDIPSRVAVDRFPRRQGAIVPPVPFLAERTIRVNGVAVMASETALKTWLRNLGAKLHRGEGSLYLRDDQTYLKAVKQNYGYSYNGREAAHIRAKYFIDFICGDPYWYSEAISTTTQSNVSSVPHAFGVSNDGGEPTPVTIEIKALASNKTGTFTLTNTTHGLSASYNGTIVMNSTLTIDCVNLKVMNGGANGLPGFAGSFWMLVAGANNLSYDGPTGVDVKVSWVSRWS